MSKKVVKKKKSKLIKTRLFTVLFAVMFIVSLFTGIKAFAETGPFKLNSATISDKATGVTGSISSFNDSEVINDITFHKLDDYATFKFELKSNLNREITILEITDDNSNSYIAYEYDKHENEKLASNGTFNFIVKAVYKTELTDTSKRNQTNNVKFTIKYLDNGEEKSDEIIVNPKTGDGIGKSIIMLVISSVGLITCITLDKKRKSKKLSKLSVLILTGLVLSPIVVKAATFAYELTLKSTIGLYDKVVVTIDDKVNPVTTQTIEYNTKLDSLPSPTKTGYTLTNWTVNNEEFDITKEITEDITIEANYRKNNYTITFNSNVPVGGTLDPATSMVDMDMKYDEEKNLLPNGYLVTGYLFDSWNTMPDGSGTKYEDMDSIKNLTSTDGETVTLYARWGATPYTVIFDKNSNEATGTMENISKAYNETFNLPENTYERTGYSFAGWNTSPMADGTHYDDKQSVKNLDIDGEVTLYAEWSPALITISFDINTDDPEATGIMAGQIVVYDVRNNINENKFTRTGYAFDSWNTEPDGSGTKYDDKADITNVFLDNTTLYAQWAVTPYTIIFDMNGGTGTQMGNQEIPYGVEANLSANTYTREHYKFMGWNSEPDGTGIHYDDEQLVKNLDIDGEITLYAEWLEATATLLPGRTTHDRLVAVNIDMDATSFKKYEGIPDFNQIEGEVIISTDDSNFPVYAWLDNETLYWWSQAQDIKSNTYFSYIFQDFTKIKSVDISEFDISNATNFERLFENCYSLESINFGEINTKKLENISLMFHNCSSLIELDLSAWNTSSLKIMNNAFEGCTSLTKLTLDNWDLSKLTSYGSWLASTPNLNTLSIENGIAPKNASSLFSDVSARTINVNNFDTENTTNMSSMFARTRNLSSLDLSSWNVEKVTNMGSMFIFSGASEINIDGWNTNSLTTANSMFNSCTNLNKIDLGNLKMEKVTTIEAMFSGTTFTELDLSAWDIASLTNIKTVFRNMENLRTIYVSDSFSVDSVTESSNIFLNTPNLVGGAGTTWESSMRDDKTYARIDDPDNGKPGLFTDIADKPIEP